MIRFYAHKFLKFEVTLTYLSPLGEMTLEEAQQNAEENCQVMTTKSLADSGSQQYCYSEAFKVELHESSSFPLLENLLLAHHNVHSKINNE